MSTNESVNEAIELLQQLGLKQYEAECFVGLSRMNMGTAKQLSDLTEVPRTRVYDAIRVLEAKGLVETQHTSPQQFRAVSLDEAMETLRDQYEDRIAQLEEVLEGAEPLETESDGQIQEVWSMVGDQAIANRTADLIEDAENEVVLVLGDESLLTDELVRVLNGLAEEVDLLVGAVTETVQGQVKASVPRAKTFVSGVSWLHGTGDDSEVDIGRLLLVDRSAILLSTITVDEGGEHAIFGRGFKNGLVVISRRLMAQGLVPGRDPKEV